MIKSKGKLIYSLNPTKIILEVDQGIADYYRSTIPKYFKVNKPLYGAHISVVRKENVNMNYWNKYNLKEIEFEYRNYIYNDELYWWLNSYSKELEDIRIELGLTGTSDITKSPDGRHKFHITIANNKNV